MEQVPALHVAFAYPRHAVFRPNKKARIMDSNGAWTGNCECGVKAKLCTVKRPGTNMGRQFFGCGTWSILKGRGDCRLMKWADEL